MPRVGGVAGGAGRIPQEFWRDRNTPSRQAVAVFAWCSSVCGCHRASREGSGLEAAELALVVLCPAPTSSTPVARSPDPTKLLMKSVTPKVVKIGSPAPGLARDSRTSNTCRGSAVRR